MTPVPGVWYVTGEGFIETYTIEQYDQDLLVVWLPRQANDPEPWLTGGHERLTKLEQKRYWPDLVEVFNPHPPTRIETQWATDTVMQAGGKRKRLDAVEEFETELGARQHAKQSKHRVLLSRTVQVSEWQEVTE